MNMKKRNIKNLIKIILIAFCIIFLITTIANTIISKDIMHIENCDNPECQKCLIIHNAIEYSKNINYLIIYVALLNAIIPLICSISSKIKLQPKETLIQLRVIMNE